MFNLLALYFYTLSIQEYSSRKQNDLMIVQLYYVYLVDARFVFRRRLGESLSVLRGIYEYGEGKMKTVLIGKVGQVSASARGRKILYLLAKLLLDQLLCFLCVFVWMPSFFGSIFSSLLFISPFIFVFLHNSYVPLELGGLPGIQMTPPRALQCCH